MTIGGFKTGCEKIYAKQGGEGRLAVKRLFPELFRVSREIRVDFRLAPKAQGDCNVVLDDGGFILPGLPGANRSALTLNSAKGPIEWGQKGDLVFSAQAHIKCAGTNFICRGNGTLKLTSTTKAQIGPQAKFQFADTGKVEIPSGVTYTVQSITVGGESVAAGLYDKNSTGLMAGRITGDGKLQVNSKSGMMFIFR